MDWRQILVAFVSGEAKKGEEKPRVLLEISRDSDAQFKTLSLNAYIPLPSVIKNPLPAHLDSFNPGPSIC